MTNKKITVTAIARDFYEDINEDGYAVDKLHKGFIDNALKFMVEAIESGDKEEMAFELVGLMDVVYRAGWDDGIENAY